MENKEGDVKVTILPNAPKLYAVSAGIGFSSTDFRLTFINEIVQTDKGKVAEIVGQVAMAPIVAKRLRDLLVTSIKNYEEIYGEIKEPEPKKK